MNPVKKIEITEPGFLKRVKDKMRTESAFYRPGVSIKTYKYQLPFASL